MRENLEILNEGIENARKNSKRKGKDSNALQWSKQLLNLVHDLVQSPKRLLENEINQNNILTTMAAHSQTSTKRRPVNKEGKEKKVVTPMRAYVLFLVNMILSVFALYVVGSIWPNTGSSSWAYNESVSLFFQQFTMSGDVTVLWIVIMMGALGALVYTTTALVTRVANKKFDSSWTLWYLVHPLLGSSLAVIFYFALRGGLLNLSSSTTVALNVYGVAAISGLVGLCSKEATYKLKEMFNTIFEAKESSSVQNQMQSPPAKES
jgi:hypothetical protein